MKNLIFFVLLILVIGLTWGCESPTKPTQKIEIEPETAKISASATPDTVVAGDPVTITWSASNADYCITPFGVSSTSGNAVVSPRETTTYVISAVKNKTKTTAEVIVVVKPAPIEVGRPYRDGIIAHIDSTGKHGWYFTLSSTEMTWKEAKNYAMSKGGRLPTIEECFLLYNNRNKLFSNITFLSFWSSESVTESSGITFVKTVIFVVHEFQGRIANSWEGYEKQTLLVFDF
ncbi:MAG: hypothetical protein KF816_08405 [Melioribacteraceae bacterium]|nr:hypothetical protein [Melioribacteraceae bacterium]